jgi:PhnB protein
MATKKKAKAKSKRAAKPAKKKISYTMPGYRAVTAGLNLPNAAATIAFCKSVFGAKTSLQVSTPDGKLMHALITIGDATVMVADAVRDPVRTAALCVYVPSVDKTFAKAVKAGATALMPPTDMLWGDRVARVTDSQGNTWVISTHIEDVSIAQIKKRAAAMVAEMTARQTAAMATSSSDQPN